MNTENSDRELFDLGRKLAEACATYDAMVAAIPAGTSVEIEQAAIDAAAAPVRALALRIADMTAQSDQAHEVKAKAHAFLAGRQA